MINFYLYFLIWLHTHCRIEILNFNLGIYQQLMNMRWDSNGNYIVDLTIISNFIIDQTTYKICMLKLTLFSDQSMTLFTHQPKIIHYIYLSVKILLFKIVQKYVLTIKKVTIQCGRNYLMWLYCRVLTCIFTFLLNCH